MRLTSKKIIGIKVNLSKKELILEEIRKYLENYQLPITNYQNITVKPLVIITPNPEIIAYARKDTFFRKIVNSAQINIPDGAGISWAAKKLYQQDVEQIPGADFMLDLCELSHEKHVRIGLIGGRGVVALETRECLHRKYPELRISVFECPEFEIIKENRITYKVLRIKYKDNQLNSNTKYVIRYTKESKDSLTEMYFHNLSKEIVKQDIRIIFVALGFPKQEYFIESLKLKAKSEKLTHPLVMMAVGGAFDYISGKVPRAPQWMQDRGLEWLFRLVLEPWRIRRQLSGAKFFLDVLFQPRASG